MELPCDPAIPVLWIFLKECESSYYKGTCTPMFTVALSTVAKIGHSQGVPQLMNGLENVVFIYNGILFSHKEE
jgi:hypothetical protein